MEIGQLKNVADNTTGKLLFRSATCYIHTHAMRQAITNREAHTAAKQSITTRNASENERLATRHRLNLGAKQAHRKVTLDVVNMQFKLIRASLPVIENLYIMVHT